MTPKEQKREGGESEHLVLQDFHGRVGMDMQGSYGEETLINGKCG